MISGAVGILIGTAIAFFFSLLHVFVQLVLIKGKFEIFFFHINFFFFSKKRLSRLMGGLAVFCCWMM